MKKALLLFLAGAFVLAGCDKNNEENGGGGTTDPNAPKITVTPPQVNATYEGGDFTVNYTVENSVDGANVSATPGDAWVKVTSAADGVINFTVDAFTETENRSTLVEVVYDYGDGSVKTQFNVVQSGVEDNVTLIDEISVMQIVYYGRISSEGSINAAEGPYGYQVQIVDKPLQDGYIAADAVVLTLMFLSDQAPVAEDLSKPVPADKIILPDGEYAVGSYGAGSVWNKASYIQKVNSNGNAYEFERSLAEGSVTIANNGTEVSISAKITDEDGGEWDVDAAVVPSAYEGRFSSTLEGDKEVNLEGSEVTALYYGTNRYQGCNLPVWFIQYLTTDKEILQFEFVAPSGSTFASGFPTGTFTAATNALNANTFVPGFNQSGYLYGSWYMTIVQQTQQGYQVGDPMASLVGGTVEITKDGDNYTVKINAQDDISYNITAEWTGTINAQDASQQMAPARITSVPDSRISLESVTDNLFRK